MIYFKILVHFFRFSIMFRLTGINFLFRTLALTTHVAGVDEVPLEVHRLDVVSHVVPPHVLELEADPANEAGLVGVHQHVLEQVLRLRDRAP